MMGVGRFPRLVREVGVLAMPDAGLNIMQQVESVSMVPLADGLLRLLVARVAGGVIIDHCCVLEGVDVTL
jgi:hypothetical protein